MREMGDRGDGRQREREEEGMREMGDRGDGRQREEGGRRHEGEREGRLYSVSTVLVAQFMCSFRFKPRHPGTYNNITCRIRMQSSNHTLLEFQTAGNTNIHVCMCNPCI